MTPLHAFGMLLIVATAALTGLTLLGIVAALARRRPRLALGLAGGLALWCTLHLGLVAVVSARTPDRVLLPGEVKRFCGFYLDCHLGAAVVGRHQLTQVGGRRARGVWEVITVEISSDARGATLQPYGLQAVLVDARGTRYPRDREAERAWNEAHGGPPAFEQPVPPHGGFYDKDLFFDVPARTPGLALDIRERGFPDDLLEWLLPGDDDSFMHPPVLLRLPPD